MHIHLGIVEGLRVFAYVLVAGFFWRLISAHLSDTSTGQAMSFIY